MKLADLVGFRRVPVTLILLAAYVALFASIIVTHVTVPAAPETASPERGVNLTEAWADLQELTNGYHPYNSRRNDEIRNWLLLRLQQIFVRNGVSVGIEPSTELTSSKSTDAGDSPVVIFNDMSSNLTY